MTTAETVIGQTRGSGPGLPFAAAPACAARQRNKFSPAREDAPGRVSRAERPKIGAAIPSAISGDREERRARHTIRPGAAIGPVVGKPLHGPLENARGEIAATDDVVEFGATPEYLVGHAPPVATSESAVNFGCANDLVPHIHNGMNAHKSMHRQDMSVCISKLYKSEDNVRMQNAIFDRVQKRMTELGMTLNGVSDAAGLNRNYLRVTLARPNAAPRTDTLDKLARALQTTPEWLMRGDGPMVDDEYTRKSAAAAAMPPIADWPVNIPVLGTTSGSLERGAFRLSGDVVEHVRCPPGLIGKTDIYALYCVGTSMEPKYQAGDLILLNPHRPPKAGDVVVVQSQAGPDGETEASLGFYLGETEQGVTLGKLNPPDKTVDIARAQIVAIHRVVTNNEMFGI